MLYLFIPGKKVLEWNNEHTRNSRIKLPSPSNYLFFILFLTRYQAQYLNEKPYSCKVLQKSECTNAFSQSCRGYLWRWRVVNPVTTCAHECTLRWIPIEKVPRVRWTWTSISRVLSARLNRYGTAYATRRCPYSAKTGIGVNMLAPKFLNFLFIEHAGIPIFKGGGLQLTFLCHLLEECTFLFGNCLH